MPIGKPSPTSSNKLTHVTPPFAASSPAYEISQSGAECKPLSRGADSECQYCRAARSRLPDATHQKINFKPNCVDRAAPPPTWGLAICTSGVVVALPNPPVLVGLLCWPVVP